MALCKHPLIFVQIISLLVPSVAIVILNYNGRKHLENFLPSVLASTYANKRIIVADNGSTDNSIAFLKDNFSAIEILRNSTNEGFAGGYNWALKGLESDYYVLLNSDVSVTPGWIEPIIRLMESDKNIGACQPKLLSYANPQLFEYAGAAGGWIDAFGYPFSRGRVFDVCELDTNQYNNTQQIFWASGASMFVRANIYAELGGLDASFFAHQEEIDLCWRMQLEGYHIMICPSSVVYHIGGGTLTKENPRKTFLNFRNNLIMLYKNLSGTERILVMLIRFFLDAVSAWKSLVSGKSSYFFAVAKAHFGFFSWLLFYRSKSLYAKDRKGKIYGKFNGNIVLEHFIKRKNRFSEIIPMKK